MTTEIPDAVERAVAYLTGARNSEDVALRALYARLARAELEKIDARLTIVRAGVASVEGELARLAMAT